MSRANTNKKQRPRSKDGLVKGIISSSTVNQRAAEFEMLNNYDWDEDPLGQTALKKIDFSNAGFYCPQKNYTSPTEASLKLEQSKTRIQELLKQARSHQINQFRNAMHKVVHQDHCIQSMPVVRISAAAPDRAKKLGTLQLRNVMGLKQPSPRLGSAPREQDRTPTGAKRGESQLSGKPGQPAADRKLDSAFDAASAHHRFDKHKVAIRNMHKSLFLSQTRAKESQGCHRQPFAQIGSMDLDHSFKTNKVSSAQKPIMRGSIFGERNQSFSLNSLGNLAKIQPSATQNMLQNTPQNVTRQRLKVMTEKAIGGNVQDMNASIFNTKNSMFMTAGSIEKSIFSPSNVKASSFLRNENSHLVRSLLQSQVPGGQRAAHRFKFMDPASSDEEEEEQFTANPAEDIPKNKLTEKLRSGIQSFVQRMMKREGFRVVVKKAQENKWTPPPRECHTLTTSDYRMFLVGGLNYDAIREVTQAKIVGDEILWERVPYNSLEPIVGRQNHTTVYYNHKLITFGGCFKFNMKRQCRECTSQVLEFDIYESRYDILKTKGYSVGARKNHCATMFQKSMVVYGGITENGSFFNEMLVFHVENREWSKLTFKNGMLPFVQGACVSVLPNKSMKSGKNDDVIMKSDAIMEGIYFFGGKNEKGDLPNRLRYFRPVTVDNKVIHGDFSPIKTNGAPPCGRYGHTMAYLPVNNCLLIVGGRNDVECTGAKLTPFLNDIHLFLLDQKVWLRVKHSVFSEGDTECLGNHSMAVVTDGDSYEKILIFGGIVNHVAGAETFRDVKSQISNTAYILQIKQRSAVKSIFNTEPPQPSKQQNHQSSGNIVVQQNGISFSSSKHQLPNTGRRGAN